MSHITRSRRVIVRTTWHCSSCQKELSGEQILCDACGSGKDTSEAYAPPKDIQTASEVIEPKELAQALSGPNWNCEFCGGQERNLNGACLHCGGAKPVMRVPPPLTPPPRMYFDSSGRKMLWIGVGITIVVLSVIVFLLVRAFRPVKGYGTVERMTWERVVMLDHRTVHPGEGWKRKAPSGAYDFTCRDRKSGTEDCNPYDCRPHDVDYECRAHDCHCSTRRESCHGLDNGYMECDEVTRCDTCYDTCTRTEYDRCYHTCDVIEPWCTYRYDTWAETARDTAQGTDANAVWPTKLSATGVDERLRREERYAVYFNRKTDSGMKTGVYKTTSYASYARFTPGDTWLLKVYRSGRIEPVRVIRAEKE